MLSRRSQKRTAYLLLVLIGLVGALGRGLHDIFGCSHDCHCCTETACPGVGIAPKAATSGKSACGCKFCHAANEPSQDSGTKQNCPSGSLNKSHEDCAICQLLSHFHTTTTVLSWQHSVQRTHGTIAISLPSIVTGSSLRLEPSRGPPAQPLQVASC